MNTHTLSILGTYVLYLAITVLPPLCIAGKKSQKKIFWILAWFILVIPAMYRYETGVDWTGYQNTYDYLVRYGGNFLKAPFNIETSFKLFAYISYKTTQSSLLLFGLYAGLTNFFALYGIYRLRDKFNVSWALFVYTTMLYFIQYNLGRQFLAMMIIFVATKDIIERKPMRFIVWVLLATAIHKTALLCMILYTYGAFVEKDNKYKKVINLGFYIGPIIALFFIQRITLLASILLGNSKYDNYILGGTGSIGLGAIVQIFTLALVIYETQRRRNTLASEAGLLTFSMRTYVLATILFMLQYFMTNFGGRIYLYFLVFQTTVFGVSLSGVSRRRNGSILISLDQVIIVALLAFQAIWGIYTNAQGHVPYAFYIP